MKKQDYVYLAIIAQISQRYQQSIQYITKVAEYKQGLTHLQKNILSISYKNQISKRKTSLRVLESLLIKVAQNKQQNHYQIIKQYKITIQQEIIKMSLALIQLLNELIIPNTSQSTDLVYYLKLKGDYYRQLSQIFQYQNNQYHHNYKILANTNYSQAEQRTKQLIKSTHPTRLGLVLSRATFYYQVLNNKIKAIQIAQIGYDEAMDNIGDIQEQYYKDSMMIIQLLKQNLVEWKNEDQSDNTE